MKTRKAEDICGINHHRGASNPCEICGKKFPVKPQHTPTPFTIVLGDKPRERIVIDNEGVELCRTISGDAAFIVRAVNSHEELLRLVKELSEIPLLSETPGIAKGVRWSEMDELICEAREAIAKAEDL